MTGKSDCKFNMPATLRLTKTAVDEYKKESVHGTVRAPIFTISFYLLLTHSAGTALKSGVSVRRPVCLALAIISDEILKCNKSL